jgi:hypothetical protein
MPRGSYPLALTSVRMGARLEALKPALAVR